jgi:hypothetical protein
MLNENIVYIAAAVHLLVGQRSYLVATLRGRAKPHRVSWFFFALVPWVAYVAELNEGVGTQAVLTLMVGFGPTVIFLVSFINKKASWSISRFDIACGILAAVGVILWLITREGAMAILLMIMADIAASVPTLVKAYRYPWTESPWVFCTGCGFGGLTLLTIDDWNFATYGFPGYIFAICALLAILIIFRVGERFGNGRRDSLIAAGGSTKTS